MKRLEGVHHHRQLLGLLRAKRRLGAARVRAVRDAVGVQRDRAVLDPLAAHELGAGVVDHLVGHHVGVVVRNRHRRRIEVVGARAERADDEPVALEGLVHGRRQVDAAHARLEVVDAEGPGVVEAVPAHQVEGVVDQRHLEQAVLLLHDQPELPLLVDRLQVRRPPDVALRVRRHLGELAVLVAIALRRPHVAGALDHQALQRPGIEAVAVQHASRNHQVVAVLEGQLAQGRLEHAAALADIDHLVALGVAVEELVGAGRLHERHRDVGVEQQRNPVERQAAARPQLMGPEVPVPELPFGIGLPLQVAHRPHRLHRRGLVQVVQQRRGPREPLVADQLLGQQRAVAPEHRVPLVRHRTQRVIDRHRQ